MAKFINVRLVGNLKILVASKRHVPRLPQIVQNVRQGHTGRLSLITYALNFLGGAARVFTVLTELDDKIALTSAVSGVVQNGVLVAQIVLLGGIKTELPKKGL